MDPVEELVDIIEVAFHDVTRPEGDLIVPNRDGAGDELLAASCWQDLDDALVNRDYDALIFATNDGFRYLIPAYMRAYLRDPDSLIADAAVDALQPSDLRWRPGAMDRFATFDMQQCRAVVMFLAYAAMLGDWGCDCDKALDYWTSRVVEARVA